MRSSLIRMRSSLTRMRSSLIRMRSSLIRMRSSLSRMRSSLIRMRSSLMVRASDRQCTSCNGPGFDPSICRHSGIWGAADEAVLNIVRKNINKNLDPHQIKIRIRIRIKVIAGLRNRIRFKINLLMTSQNVWNVSLFEHFFKGFETLFGS